MFMIPYCIIMDRFYTHDCIFSFSVLLVIIAGVIFGVKKEDREWMPRPDQNYLSWSYGFFIISGFFVLFAAALLLKAGRDARKSIREDYPGKPKY